MKGIDDTALGSLIAMLMESLMVMEEEDVMNWMVNCPPSTMVIP